MKLQTILDNVSEFLGANNVQHHFECSDTIVMTIHDGENLYLITYEEDGTFDIEDDDTTICTGALETEEIITELKVLIYN